MSNGFKFINAEKKELKGGILYRVTKDHFPALDGVGLNAVRLEVGAIREPHLHPNCSQLDYCLSGKARVGIIGPDGETQLIELDEGDMAFVPRGNLHWIENIGKGQLHTLILLTHERPETIEFSQMLGGIPNETLSALFGVSKSVFDAIPNITVKISNPTK
jgi:oxalate decarboxylase